jgi:toxin FitB
VARVVLDTDVASLSYKGRLPASLAARLIGQEVCVTFVTIGELSRWAEKRRWGTRARTELVGLARPRCCPAIRRAGRVAVGPAQH